jgi:hypothetical protein
VAESEIGREVQFDPSPIAINEIIKTVIPKITPAATQLFEIQWKGL